MNWIKSCIIDIKFVSLQRKTRNSKELLLVKGAKYALKNSNISLVDLFQIIHLMDYRYRYDSLLWNILECPIDVALEQLKYTAKNAVEEDQKVKIRQIFGRVLSYLGTQGDSERHLILYKKSMRWFKRFYGTAGAPKKQ